VEEIILGARLLTRLPTSAARVLPDFIIIGAQKAGTTALYSYLVQHPLVTPALRKETHFFDNHFNRGLFWYRAFFPMRRHQHRLCRIFGIPPITGEASPYYLFHPLVPRRIQQLLPGVRLIVLLRNPVDRAYSHYHHEVAMGHETLSFEEAIKQEAERLQTEHDRLLTNPAYRSYQHQHHSYLARGMYADQLQPWLELFPAIQLLILRNEDLKQTPSAVFQQVLAFLGLPEQELHAYPEVFKGSYGQMVPETRARLLGYFAPHNRRLYDLLGRDFDWDR
jgi:hypothetical protein